MKNIKEIIALICCCNLVFPVSVAMAAPQGGKVVGGSAHIHQSGATTTINQSSNRAVINWNSFDIGKSETVRHNMPSANSAGLHRVVGGGGASQIMGQLQSNGNVYLVNPAGVVIHKGARIDANSFTATSRDISNDNFMKGNMVFDKPGRPDAEVINQGTISVKENGLAALVAPTVRNDGVIAGKLAKVALASGDSTWKLDMHGDDLITFTVDEKDVDTLHAVDGTPLAGVENSGSIKAEGGVVVLTAAQLDGIVGSVVNSGEVSAASAELKGGKIVFKGAGSGVDIVNTGTVDASSAVADGGSVRMDTDGTTRSSGVIAVTGGQQGGKVVMTGKDVALTGKAKIDVSGNKGGGTALVGGNALGKGPERNAQTTKVEKDATIVADARTKGDGGQVVVWSDEKTNFDGSITARGGNDSGNGGKVETSGKSLKVGNGATVNTSASKGVYGQWLLDPEDIVIANNGYGDISAVSIISNLVNNDVIIESNGIGSSGGSIYVNDVISWSSDTMLTLSSYKSLYVNSDISFSGDKSGIIFIANRENILEPSDGYNIYINSKINGNGNYSIVNFNKKPIFSRNGKISLVGDLPEVWIDGKNFKIIKNIYDLQEGLNIDGYFCVVNDINASITKEWNNGKGFEPLFAGDIYNRFHGFLYGFGNTIDGLYINRPDEDYVGLFRGVSDYYHATRGIYDLKITNAYIYGDKNVGILSGIANNTFIDNVQVDGIVIGNTSVGGIIGRGGRIWNSTNKANVSGKENIGGLVGERPITIQKSSNHGDIIGQSNVGGLIGIGNSGTITESYNCGSVTGTIENVGGLVGKYLQGISISDSYSNGNIKGGKNVGGLIGLIMYGDIHLKNLYSTSNVSGENIGALIGEVSSEFGYSGKVVFTGNSYWNKDISGVDKGIGSKNNNVETSSGSPIELTIDQIKSQTSFQGWDFENIWAIDEGQSFPYLRPVTATVPGPSPDPDPGIDPTPDPDPTPTPDPDTGLNPGPDDDESAEGKYPGGGMVLYDELLGKHYLFKDNTKYYIVTDEPTRVGGMSVINLTEMNRYEDKINSEIKNINEYYDELIKDATWDLGLTAIRIELSTILSALNPFDLMKGGVGVVGSLFSDAIKADEKIAYSNSYRLQCGYYLLLEQYLVNSNYYLEEAKDIYDNAVLNHRGLSAYEKREISDLFDKSEKCLENAENIRNNKKEIESWLTTYAIGETSNDLFSLGLSSTLDAIPVKTSSDAEEILTNVVKEGSVNTVEESLDLGSINANDVFNLCTTNIPWNSEVGKVKKNFENSFNRTLNI